MIDHFDVDALGARVRVVFDDDMPPGSAESALLAWADAAASRPGEPDVTVSIGAERASDATPERITAGISLAAMRHVRGRLLMLNAAGVADQHGRVAAFINGSGRTKTDLSRAFGDRYDYVSDETVGVDSGGRVWPHRKPLTVVRGGSATQLAPSALGLRLGDAAALRLSSITILERDADASAPSIESVEFCDAVAEVLPQTSFLAELPTPLQTLAELVDRTGGFTRLRCADLESVGPLVGELLDHRGPPEPWHPVTVPDSVLADGMLGGRFTAAAVLDAVRFADRTAIFTRGRVRVLDGIGPLLWDALCAGRDFDGVVNDLVAEFGEPPQGDAPTIVRTALDDFVYDGILALG